MSRSAEASSRYTWLAFLLPGGGLILGEIAGYSVEGFADDVGVAGMAGGFFDHVNQDPAQRSFFVATRANDIKAVRRIYHGG